MTIENIKQTAYNYCLTYLEKKMDQINKNILDLNGSLSSESKSTAGDKHDTGRAMIHLEMEKKGKQFIQLSKQKEVVLKIDPNLKSNKIQLGSLIETNENWYYISIGAGSMITKDKPILFISLASPIAQRMKTETVNSIFSFMNKNIEIISIQ